MARRGPGVGVCEACKRDAVECTRYEEERDRLIGAVKAVIGEEEWARRLEQEDGGTLTVLGLYQGETERDAKALVVKTKVFLVEAWRKRSE